MAEVLPKYSAVIFSSESTGEFIDGTWKVISNIIEKRRKEDGEWEEARVEAMGMDTSFLEAYKTSIISVGNQFNDLLLKNNSKSMFKEPSI